MTKVFVVVHISSLDLGHGNVRLPSGDKLCNKKCFQTPSQLKMLRKQLCDDRKYFRQNFETKNFGQGLKTKN